MNCQNWPESDRWATVNMYHYMHASPVSHPTKSKCCQITSVLIHHRKPHSEPKSRSLCIKEKICHCTSIKFYKLLTLISSAANQAVFLELWWMVLSLRSSKTVDPLLFLCTHSICPFFPVSVAAINNFILLDGMPFWCLCQWQTQPVWIYSSLSWSYFMKCWSSTTENGLTISMNCRT